MEKLYSRIRNFKLPKKDEINSVFTAFSKNEKIIFAALVLALFISTVSILQSINKSLMVEVPFRGGSISEGIIGVPRFINPILANSSVDQDLVSLIYSGLMRKNPDGTLTPDLAEKYEISQNGLSYTFTLKDKIYFQDGKPVTADDVIFTVNKAKDSVIKSLHKVHWDGVTAAKINDMTIEFTLRQPRPSFLENATLGIMPQSLWDNSPIELNDANTAPVGSGPYMIKSVAKESSGIINSYELTSFEEFILGEPFIKTINLHFYSNEDDLIRALEEGAIDQVSSITPSNADDLKEKNYRVESSVLPRVFGLFFNQNQNNLFTDKIITKAIDQAIDKDKIAREVLFGYGIAIDDPIPPNMIAYQKLAGGNGATREEILKNVQDSLAKDGWSKGPDGFLQKTTADKNKKKTTATLQFSISTGNAPELALTAELIRQDLSAIGMKVDIKTFEVGNLNQSVIRPRKYDALLFGQIINNESDLYAFWHSSQRKDPGLNVALYTNAKVDKILEEAFTTQDEQERVKKYAQFEDEIKKDMPAVFLYSPNFIYVVSKNLMGFSIDHITSPADRFLNIYSWYTKTENVWKIFSK
ncbi:MAG: Extracellular solute-binding protein family 5 [Candidatus Nomurabacteria bacterium GW2011_GWF2_43_8]|uniref:Extracellular solute-binding protein family 5 n=3 Tax=Candidatus Nomuraibacteriota TaxID=1752729 RepID=A0A0G1HRN9_9BACT|nr:MAG: Extracellular solute-binding protein family 5 [Candidatus Nomurabacteria bacterium GW2011_GWA2_43_15]KKT19229.1 MAG: Extracellular solute-binding protein family 5 [Candidatus Nomurabacteria bacterium GW2011_GWB1_43_7]KKT22252.1 MAG: Extracellular solute-binding protein family 5 [Candidatus Nomurabacteria bacterium GW2011_GWF2_43_8]